MPKTPSIGDLVTLPSGAKARIVVPADPSRPWAAIETGYLWHVCREHGIEGRPSASFVMHPTRKHPLQLDETDARALAAILNAVR